MIRRIFTLTKINRDRGRIQITVHIMFELPVNVRRKGSENGHRNTEQHNKTKRTQIPKTENIHNTGDRMK